ncbi:MAG: hypothetical protein WBB09_04870, partial [Candidatus Microthrix parvicella]
CFRHQRPEAQVPWRIEHLQRARDRVCSQVGCGAFAQEHRSLPDGTFAKLVDGNSWQEDRSMIVAIDGEAAQGSQRSRRLSRKDASLTASRSR